MVDDMHNLDDDALAGVTGGSGIGAPNGLRPGAGRTGQGVDEGDAIVPNLIPPTGPTSNTSASLANLSQGGNRVDTETLLMQMAIAMRDTEATSQKGIQTDQSAKQQEMQEKAAKIAEAIAKMGKKGV